ncbi:hypothetical protein EMIT0215P_60250 [Pseudomonas serboccidentalis]
MSTATPNHNNKHHNIAAERVELIEGHFGPRPCLSITSEEVIARLPIYLFAHFGAHFRRETWKRVQPSQENILSS